MDMDDLDGAAKTTKAARPTSTNPFGKLPDGDYVAEIVSGCLKVTEKGYKIVEIELQVDIDPVSRVAGKHEYWLKGKEGVDTKRIASFKSDLKTMGFVDVDDCDSFTAYLELCFLAMPGIKLFVKKKTTESNGKNYVNIYINGRAAESDKPAKAKDGDALADGKPFSLSMEYLEHVKTADKSAVDEAEALFADFGT